MDKAPEKDPLAIDSSDFLSSNNIEFVVEEDSELENIITLDSLNKVLANSEHIRRENTIDDIDDTLSEGDIIIYVEEDGENPSKEDDIHENDDEDIIEIKEENNENIDEDSRGSTISSDVADQQDEITQSDTDISDKDAQQGTRLRSYLQKSDFNKSFVSFVGKEIEKNSPSQNLRNRKNSNKDESKSNDKNEAKKSKDVDEALKSKGSDKNEIEKSKDVNGTTELSSNLRSQKLENNSKNKSDLVHTSPPKRRKLQEVSNEKLPTKSSEKIQVKPTVMQKKTSAKILKPVGKTVPPPILPALPAANSLVYVVGPSGQVPGGKAGLQGVVPVGMLPPPLLQAISQQTGSQKATLVLVPPGQALNSQIPIPPLIVGNSMVNTSTNSKDVPAPSNRTQSYTYSKKKSSPALPLITDVRSINSSEIADNTDTSGSRKISILSKSQINNSVSQNKQVEAPTETVSMMVDGEEIIVTAPKNLNNTKKQLPYHPKLVQCPPPDKQRVILQTKPQLFQITDLQATSKNKNESIRITEANLCYVPGCTIQKGEKVYLFGVPVDKTLMDLWDASIGRKDKRLQNNDIVCEKHFTEDDIIFVRNVLSENGPDQVKAKPKLKKGAVPCMQYHKTCCVPNCGTSTGQMYKFPIFSQPSLHLWVYMVKNPRLKTLSVPELLKHRVCFKHFEPDCFERNGELMKTAAPTLHLPDHSATKMQKKTMDDVGPVSVGHLKCIFPDCDEKQITGQEKNVFQFPSNYTKCKQWLAACNRLDLVCPDQVQTERLLRALTAGVCQDHFNIKDYDGPTLYKLKSDAVPKSQDTKDGVSKKNCNTTDMHTDSIDLTNQESPALSDTESVPEPFNQCIYLNCTTEKETPDVQLFPIPIEPPSRFRLWLECCGYKDIGSVINQGNFNICSKHFTSVMLTTENDHIELKPHAVPMFSFDSVSVDENSNKNKLYNRVVKRNTQIAVPCKELMFCAVLNCSQAYGKASYKGMQHLFPDPDIEMTKFKLWLKLINNQALDGVAPKTIGETYIVCEKHFEAFFYSDGRTKTGPLCSVAVPTVCLPHDIKWFFATEFYKKDVKDYLRQKIYLGETENEIRWLPSKLIDKSEPKNVCVLEEDRLSFPGIGYHLQMDKREKSNQNRKVPYDIYRYTCNHGKASYGLMKDVELGESLQIHTAIIINDDDEMERNVLQELLDKSLNRVLETPVDSSENTAVTS